MFEWYAEVSILVKYCDNMRGHQNVSELASLNKNKTSTAVWHQLTLPDKLAVCAEIYCAGREWSLAVLVCSEGILQLSHRETQMKNSNHVHTSFSVKIEKNTLETQKLRQQAFGDWSRLHKSLSGMDILSEAENRLKTMNQEDALQQT